MKKICLLVYDISLFGGAERVAVNLANELANYYDVHLISCFYENKIPAFKINENVTIDIVSEDTKSMTVHCLSMAFELAKIYKNNDISLVLNITAGVNSISYVAARNTGVKVIYCEHSNLVNKTYGKKHEFRQWIGAKTSDLVVTLTDADKAAFEKRYGIEGKVKYIYNWYEGPVSKEYNVLSTKIISVGRLKSVKGYDRMVKVAEIVLAKHKDWSWHIYGEGDYDKTLKSLIDEAGLQSQMILMGNDPDVVRKYKDYAICVMTSYYEGFALALVEAEANLVPAVSFDCPTGPGEIIQNDFNGYLVDDGNIEKMAEVINMLIDNPDVRERLSYNGADTIKKFDKHVICDEWIKTIETLLEDK